MNSYEEQLANILNTAIDRAVLIELNNNLLTQNVTVKDRLYYIANRINEQQIKDSKELSPQEKIRQGRIQNKAERG